MPASPSTDLTPLEMARNAAAAVLRYADHQAADPVQAYIAQSGERAHSAAQLAGCMALVSIADDLHRITEKLLEVDELEHQEP